MPATLTASISSLILTLDDPGRDDLDSVIVWASTTSGFTPSAANLVYQGKSLKIVISNLTPSITYYVKYAYLSQIDTSDYVVSAQLSGVPVKVTESLIDDGAISLAKFAAGIEPIEIVSSLPSVGNFQGRTVFLTTDNKLYRYNGTAFVSTVPAGDLTGQITTTQITDDAITTAKIAANAITATELAASSVIAGKIAAGAISTTELAAGAVTAAKIAAGTITATEIAASTITGAKLAADTITAANIAANAITSSELAAGSVIAGKIAANAVTATEISANAITSSKIETNALRGKTLAGGVLIDGGSVVTIDTAKPANIDTTTTVYLDDTTDFPPSGAAIVLSKNGGVPTSSNTISYVAGDGALAFDNRKIRYTGKTSNSLTGVSGLQYKISSGDVIIPQPFPSITLDSYTIGDIIDTTYNAEFLFRRTGGSALAINQNRNADLFSYTAGHVLSGSSYNSELSGVTGLAAFSLGYNSRATIIDLTATITTVVAATGTVSSLTINASTSFLKSGGGQIILASTTVTGFKKANYISYSATTVTLEKSLYLNAGTYYIIPISSVNVFGSDPYSLINFNNSYNGEWRQSQLSTNYDYADTVHDRLLLTPSFGYGLRIYPSKKASKMDAAGILISQPDAALHFEVDAIPASSISSSSMPGAFSSSFHFGAASGYAGTTGGVFVSYNGTSVQQYQPISNTLRFNGFDVAAADAITFDDATDTYSFGSDGTANNATLNAKNSILTLGASYLIQNANAKTVADAAVAQTQNQFIVWNASSTLPQISIGNQASSVNGSNIDGYKARGGNTTTITAPVLDDNILALRGYLYDGAIWRIAASIKYQVDGAPSGADAPGRIVFATTDDGSTSHIDRLTIDSAGEIINTGGGRLGYGTGSGAAATQSTSRTTSVSINSAVGRITLFTAAGSTTWASFTVNNSKVGTNDIIVLNQRTGTNLYELHVTAVAAGSFQISFRTTGGTASDTPTISFAIIRGSNA